MKVRLKRLGILLIMTLSLFICATTSTAIDYAKESATTEEITCFDETPKQLSSELDYIQSPLSRLTTLVLSKEDIPLKNLETLSTEIQAQSTETTEVADATEMTEVTEHEETETEVVEKTEPTEEVITEEPKWNGPVLDAYVGTIKGPSGKETYYDLPMQGVIAIMEDLGYVGDEWYFWIREDGVKMYGKYIMCAANLDIRPKGTIIETSLGTAMVCDTGGFAKHNQYQLDIATDWTNRNGY